MARKKRNRKPQANPGKPAPQASLAPHDELKACLAEKRGRKAIAVAKDMLKAGQAQPEHVPLFAAAYSLRAKEMLADGHGREAVDMIDSVLAGHREWAEHLDPHLLLILDLHRPKPKLLPRYGQGDAALDERIANGLLANLIDPGLLANHAGLPPEHPLRAEAGLLMKAWQAVETNPGNPLPDDLRAISRRSPLAHWRLFVQALRAYYTLDQENLAANLERIPADSAVRPLADALVRLDRNEAPALPAGTAILEQTRGPSLASQLERIDQSIRQGNRARTTALANELCDSLRKQGRAALAADIEAFVILELGQGDDYLGRFEDRRYTNRERLRQILPRLVIAIDPENWELLELVIESIKGFQPSELALLWREAATMRMNDALYGGGTHIGPSAQLLIDDCFRQSVKACPLRDTFRLWHAAQKCMDTCGEAIAAWAKFAPDDPDMWRERVQDLRDANDAKGALAAFDELVQRTGNTPQLAELRGYIQLDLAADAFRRGDLATTRAAAAGLEPRSPLFAVGKAVAEWMLAEGKKARRDTGEILAAAGLPLAAFHVARRFDPELTVAKLPSAVRQGLQGKELFASIVYLSTIEDPRWQLTDLPRYDWIPVNFERTKEPPEVLLDTMRALADLDSRDNFLYISILAWNGLNRPDPCPRAPFLAWRALAYETSGLNFKAHVDKLLAAALWFADFQKTDPGVVEAVAARLSIPNIRETAGRATRKSSFAILKKEAANPNLLWENAVRPDPYPSSPTPGYDEDDWDDWDDEDAEDIFDETMFDFSGDPTDPEQAARIQLDIERMREQLEALPPKERKRRINELRNDLPPALRDLSENPLDTLQAMLDMAQKITSEIVPPPKKPKPKPAKPPKPRTPPEDDRQLTFPFF